MTHFPCNLVHQGPLHEMGDIPRIVLFVQGVTEKAKSIDYTADEQLYTSVSVAQLCYKDKEEMFR